MDNEKDDTTQKETIKSKDSLIVDMYYMAEDFMRPSPKHPKYLQALLFIIKLPVLVVMLAVSPVVLLFMFIAFMAALWNANTQQ